MATYAIGDLQGCFFSFQALLKKIQFSADHDRLWFVGDLVNRGPSSLDVMRWMLAHQSSIVTVLGNHDLHTLVVAEGFVSAHRGDTIQSLLDAPDASEILNWLRSQPLIHFQDGYLMVHAGLLPHWTVNQALALGEEVHLALCANNYRDFLQQMYGNEPNAWREDLTGWDRLRVITNAMTRLRICKSDGEMEFKFKGEIENVPSGYQPWFELGHRASANTPIIFGHWSALGLQHKNNVYSLDTGCLWGGHLSAMRLEDKQIFQVPCDPKDAPLKIY